MRRLLFLSVPLLIFFIFIPVQAQSVYNHLDRHSFNLLAQETNIPLFWRSDVNKNNTIEPSEVVYLWGMRADKKLSDYIDNGKFTPEFAQAYENMIKQNQQPRPDPDTIKDPEQRRRSLVLKELNQAKPALMVTDFSNSSSEDRNIVQHLLKVAMMIENVYMKQNGVYGWEADIPMDDVASHTLFYRNHGPFCLNSLTESHPDCNALPNKPKRIVGVYPAFLQQDKNFCTLVQKHADAKNLSQPFVTVIEKNGKLATLPYTIVYQTDMKAIADELKAAADVIKSPAERAFKAYLLSASQAFTDNNWYAADEAWRNMNAQNSKWYLRIAPDEVYWDPCNLKAGFSLTFATINHDSLIWQRKLDSLKDEMEKALATLAGPPYQAQLANFHLPDFIDVVLNAGDSRFYSGGVLGQSLPNTGPVADEGRRRTMVMTNLTFPDEDSRARYIERAASLFCPADMKYVVADAKLNNMSVVLHEASHNLGHYLATGRDETKIFGGPMASMLEELKAETAAHYFTDWLVKKNMISAEVAARSHMNGLLWQFGHISQGMYTATGDIKTYNQLSAIQFGTLVKNGAIKWIEHATAANGKDKGCFEVNMSSLSASMNTLEKEILRLKATGDKQQAMALQKEMVDDEGILKKLRGIISERVLREPATTFVYSVS